ncbi:MAG: phage integrase central domain-containing protein [Oscillospiraceae bacterium]
MPAKAVMISENGRYSYQGCLDREVYPVLGSIKMPEITPAQITALLLDIQSSGKAHATAVKVYAILHGLFKMAYLGDMIQQNPMDKARASKAPKGRSKGRCPRGIHGRRGQRPSFRAA